MPPDRCQGTRTTRRTFLGSVGLAVAGLGLASRSTAAVDGEFVLEQGDQCIPLTPLSGDTPVEDLYQWGVDQYDYSATGLVPIERPDTTIMFLYDGPNGLSLVLVHDEYGSETPGGSVTMEFAGLPPDGEWVVQDDLYDGSSNFDQWARDGGTASVDWTWGEGRTDGGVFRGLGGVPDLELQIIPAFNAAATLHGEHYDGEITEWEALTGSMDAPDRTSLVLDEPVVIRRGSCTTDGGDGSDGDGSDGDGSSDDGDGSDGNESGDDGGDSGSDDDSGDDSQDGDDRDDDEYEEDEDDDDEDEEKDGDDEDDDDEDEDEDDHPGKGKGHEKGRGKGHEKGRGKGHEKGRGKGHEKGKGEGHEKHGDHDDDDDDWKDAKEELEEGKEEWKETKEKLEDGKEELEEALEGEDD